VIPININYLEWFFTSEDCIQVNILRNLVYIIKNVRMVMVNGDWFDCNDERITFLHKDDVEERLKTENCYICFYKMCEP
jgi:hypothetical protein